MAPKKAEKGGAAAAAEPAAPAKPFSVADMPYLSSGSLPEEVELARKYVICGPDYNLNTEDLGNAHSFMSSGVDNAFTLEDFKSRFSIEVTSLDEHVVKFEMKGVKAALANAFRRILLSEVPTLAIEKVFVLNNTSVLPDEVLAHRLGLVPLAVDPRLFEYRGDGDAASESNTVVLRLAVRCTRAADGSLRNDRVTSDQLEWLPAGSALPDEPPFARSQEALLARPARAVLPDILLAKMRPGQEIELEAHAVKGCGQTHAKWSPVGTAWYELCPEIALLGAPPAGEEAKAFIAEAHPPGWDAVRPTAPVRGAQSCFGLGPGGELRVLNPRGCWYCLERVRRMSGEAAWAGKVQLRRVKEHYLFTVESVGQLPPDTLFTEAVAVLREKALRLLSVT